MPYENTTPTPRVDQLLREVLALPETGDFAVDGPALDKAVEAAGLSWLAALVERAREIERDSDDYRYALQSALAGVWRPLVPSIDLTDAECDDLMRHVGIIGSAEKFQPYPEAWNAIRDRHRRFAVSYVRAILAHVAVNGPAVAIAAIESLAARSAKK